MRIPKPEEMDCRRGAGYALGFATSITGSGWDIYRLSSLEPHLIGRIQQSLDGATSFYGVRVALFTMDELAVVWGFGSEQQTKWAAANPVPAPAVEEAPPIEEAPAGEPPALLWGDGQPADLEEAQATEPASGRTDTEVAAAVLSGQPTADQILVSGETPAPPWET